MMTLPFYVAVLALILIPLIPALLRARIRFFRSVHWQWAVDIHEKYFDGLVVGIRLGLFVVAAVLLYVAL